MDLREILRRRRMVRAYEPEPISRETIERIVGTVRRAPSAGFSQGQRLVVVTDAGTRQRIADILEEASPAPRSAATLEQWLNAPVLIVVAVREDDYHDRYRKSDKLIDGAEIEWPIPYWHFDAGAAAMLILLAAIDEATPRDSSESSWKRPSPSRSCCASPTTLPSLVASPSVSRPTIRTGARSRAGSRRLGKA
jgi:nitroreductase